MDRSTRSDIGRAIADVQTALSPRRRRCHGSIGTSHCRARTVVAAVAEAARAAAAEACLTSPRGSRPKRSASPRGWRAGISSPRGGGCVRRLLGVDDQSTQPGTEDDAELFDAVLNAVRSFPEDVRVQRPGCEALADLCLDLASSCVHDYEGVDDTFGRVDGGGSSINGGGDPHSWSSVFGDVVTSDRRRLLDGLGALLVAMRVLPDDPLVLWHGCRGLSSLPVQMAVSSLKDSAMVAVLSAMKQFPTNIGVQWHGCHALARYCRADSYMQARLVDSSACTAVVSASLLFREDHGLQFHASAAMSGLCAHNSEGQQRLMNLGGCEALLTSMRTFPNDRGIQWNCCEALANLARDNAALQQQLVDEGACVAVASAMGAFSDDVGILRFGYEVVAYLSRTADTRAHTEFVDGGVCELLLRSTPQVPPDELLLLRHHTEALTSLSRDGPSPAGETSWGRLLLLRAGAAETVLAALRATTELSGSPQADMSLVVDIRRNTLEAAANFSREATWERMGDTRAECTCLSTQEAVVAIMGAMHALQLERTAQINGLETMANFGHGREDIQRMLVDLGACEAVMEAARAFPEDRDVLWHSFKVMDVCCRRAPSAPSHLIDLGACEAIATVMKTFAEDGAMHDLCFEVMRLLSKLSDGHRRFVEAGAKPTAAARLSKVTQGISAIKKMRHITTGVAVEHIASFREQK